MQCAPCRSSVQPPPLCRFLTFLQDSAFLHGSLGGLVSFCYAVPPFCARFLCVCVFSRGRIRLDLSCPLVLTFLAHWSTAGRASTVGPQLFAGSARRVRFACCGW